MTLSILKWHNFLYLFMVGCKMICRATWDSITAATGFVNDVTFQQEDHRQQEAKKQITFPRTFANEMDPWDDKGNFVLQFIKMR